MGNCASSNDDYGATARSAAIDRQIEEDSKIFRKECKILLLGRSLSFKPSNLRSEYGFGSPVNPLTQNGVTALSYFWFPLVRGTEPTLVNVGPPSSDQLLCSLPTYEQFPGDELTRCA